MEMREIGHSGIVVNGLGLGCWAIGGGSWWGENDDRLLWIQFTVQSAWVLNGLTWQGYMDLDTARKLLA